MGRPDKLPPWPVRRLVAHVVSNGEWFRLSVERGVAGVTEPCVSEQERARRLDELSNAAPDEQIAALDRVTHAFEQVYEGLTSEQLNAICYHRRGDRSARWYARHRLAEVAFHQWDLRHSLGRDATLDEELAFFLLPTLIESNLPHIYAGRPGIKSRFGLVAEGRPVSTWLLTAGPERLDVVRRSGAADVTITALPSTLALLVYGRANLAQLMRQGHAHIAGDRGLAERFHTIIPRP